MSDTYLSDQQDEILALLDDGHTWASAADEIGISQSALEEQMRRVREKQEKAERTLERISEYGRTDWTPDIPNEVNGWRINDELSYPESNSWRWENEDGQAVNVKQNHREEWNVTVSAKPNQTGLHMLRGGDWGGRDDEGSDRGSMHSAVDTAVKWMKKNERASEEIYGAITPGREGPKHSF